MEDWKKKYEDLFARLKKVFDTTKSQEVIDMLAENFREEFYESEDERIRKALINCYKGDGCLCNNKYRIPYKDVISWLEKKGETFTKKDVDDAYLKGVCDTKQELEKHGEQKHIQDGSNGFEVGDEITDGNSTFKVVNIKDGYYIADDGDKICFYVAHRYYTPVKYSYKQKPAWSEEDEMFVHGLIRGLAAKRDIHGHTTFSSDCIDITKTIDWLKALKDRVQPKQEWSEEDEITFNDALWCCEQAASIAKDDNDMGNVWYAEDFLKSLKNRHTWKPSEEQMEYLAKAITTLGNEGDNKTSAILYELRTDLKKLKG